jgi:uroporphyrin-3 C-methyltransferase
MNSSASTPKASDSTPQAEFASNPSAPELASDHAHSSSVWRSLSSARWAWVLAILACVGCFSLWMKLHSIEETLAKQSANTSELAQEAKGLAKEASELSRDTAAHLSLTDNKLSEVALQRTQLETLMQTLTHSRDENTLDELESAVHLAQQQAQMTGSVQPLLETLKLADLKLSKLSSPRFSALSAAVKHDLNLIKSTALSDTPNLLIEIDQVVHLVDVMPLANEVGLKRAGSLEVLAPRAVEESAGKPPSWVESITQSEVKKMLQSLWDGFKSLVRVSEIDHPQAILLTPEQGFFVRENLKLKLLNARLALLSRQSDVARSDVMAVNTQIKAYFDLKNKNTQIALEALGQLEKDMLQLNVPRLEQTVNALANAQASR